MQSANKLLLPLGGMSVIARTLTELAGAGFSQIVVVTGHDQEAVVDEIERYLPKISKASEISVVHNPDFERGMHSSIRAGLSALEHCDFFAVALADQPLLTTADYRVLIQAAKVHPEAYLLSPRYADTASSGRANPTLISTRVKEEILAHSDSDRGCAYLFDRYPMSVVFIEMPRTAKSLDVDTREMFDRAVEISNNVLRRPDADAIS